jgi:hypothetical protein
MIRVQTPEARAILEPVLTEEMPEFAALVRAVDAVMGVDEIRYEGPSEAELRARMEGLRKAQFAKMREMLR